MLNPHRRLTFTGLILLSATSLSLAAWQAPSRRLHAATPGEATTPTQASALVRYVDDATGAILKTARLTGPVGSNYTYTVTPPAGYTVRGDYHTVTFRFVSADPGTMTFHLVAIPKAAPATSTTPTPATPAPTKPAPTAPAAASITLHLVDQASGKVISTQRVTGTVGQTIPLTLRLPTGYVCNLTPARTLTFSQAGNTTLTWLVHRPTPVPNALGTITVRYVALTSGRVLLTQTLRGLVGQPVSLKLKAAAARIGHHYHLVAASPAGATAHFTRGQQVLTVYLQQSPQPTPPPATPAPAAVQPPVIMDRHLILPRPLPGNGPAPDPDAITPLGCYFISLAGKINLGVRAE